MTRQRRRNVLIGAAMAFLGVAAAWNINEMMRQHQAAVDAWLDLTACRQIADDFESLRGQPAIAFQAEMAAHELGRRVDAASQRAQLDPASLEGVYPQAAGRIGDSPYLEKPTSLAFRNVRLPQLAALLTDLTDNDQLRVRDLRLRVPRNEADADLWDAEVTVTSLIYAPRTGRDATNGK